MLTCCVALQTAPLNVYRHTPRGSVFARLASELFEQPTEKFQKLKVAELLPDM